MYRIFFKNRYILLSGQPDRLQKYSIFYNFDNQKNLNDVISRFQKDESIKSMNIYGTEINFLWRSFKESFVDVGAAGGLVRHTSGRYLTIVRNGIPDLPKGHIEKNESPGDCAIREVNEECGINGHTIVRKLFETYHTYRIKTGEMALKTSHWFLMEYTNDTDSSPQLEEGITETKWLLPGEMNSIRNKIWPSLVSLLDVAIKLK